MRRVGRTEEVSVAQQSAEEFYGQCISHARILDLAARRLAESGDAIGALAAAWGSDVYAAQGALWERVLGAAAAPRRQMYRASEALFAGLRSGSSTAEETSSEDTTCGDAIRRARAGLLAECDGMLAITIASSWTDPSYLDALPLPTDADIEAAARTRLAGLPPERFATDRREAASAAMIRAQELRVRGEAVEAVRAVYDAYFLAFEAYLVDSSVAAGDTALQSVTVRWELAAAAMAALPGLPDDFTAAASTLRDALCSALVDADAERLRACLPRV